MNGKWIYSLGEWGVRALIVIGDFTLFVIQTFGWMFRRPPAPGTLIPNLYRIGVRSVPVVMVTGMFIGMVMAVQSYHQFHRMGLSSRLGSMINMTLVRELGPVLAATMLAGRVGTAIAAELGTMKVTEQVDALWCLGVHPYHYLVVPRFLACTLLVPLLTVLADVMGILGGAFLCTQVFEIESHYYWMNSISYVGPLDVFMGLVKAIFFGAGIALVSCHRGLNSQGGSEGVGRALTEAFVASFLVILVFDLILGSAWIQLQHWLFPATIQSLV